MILIAGVAELVGVVLATVAVVEEEEEDTDVGVDGGEMPAYLDFVFYLVLWSLVLVFRIAQAFVRSVRRQYDAR